jgi:hypothetical protein
VDVVKFGSNYCPQNARAAAVLIEVLAGIRPSTSRRSSRNALVARRRRDVGLVVLTPTSVRVGLMFGRASLPQSERHA